MKRVTLRGVIKYVAALALSVVLLYFAFRKISLDDLWGGLRSCNYWWILATIALQWIVTYLRGNRWRIMMLPINKSINRRETYDSYAICYLANLALPRSGEVVRCGLMADTGKCSFEESLGTVVIERTWDMVCVVLVVIPLFFFGTFRDFIVNEMIVPLADSTDVGMIWIVLASLLALAVVCAIIYRARKRIFKSAAGVKVLSFLKGMADGVKAGFKMEHKWEFFGYTLLIWVSYWITSYMTILAFEGTSSLELMDALFLMVVGSLGWIVPVQGGFGAYHFIVANTLVPIYGFTASTGLIFATISHESQVVQMLLCGLVSLVSWAFYKRKMKRTI